MAAVGQRRARSPTRVFFVPPSRHLSCSLCDDNFKEVALPCGHTFCRACVVRWFERQRTCPECRADTAPGAPLPTNWTVRAKVDELRVRCRFGLKEQGDGWVADEAGCPVQLTLDGVAAHEAACGFATTTCPFAGCGVELRRSDVASHNAASMQAHLDGERAARVAGEAARLADAAAFTSRFAAMEARLSAFELRLPPARARFVQPLHPTLADGWVVSQTIAAADPLDREDDDDDGNSSEVWCCAFSPDGSTVCVGLQTASLKLFDVASSDHRLTLEGHEYAVNCCAFSQDGSTIVSASDDFTWKLWDAASGAVICTLKGHANCVLCCTFSPAVAQFVPDLSTNRSISGKPQTASVNAR